MRSPKSLWSRGQVAAFMATFANAVGDRRAAEGYILALVAYVAFSKGPEPKEIIG